MEQIDVSKKMQELARGYTEEHLREMSKVTECVFGFVGNGFAIVVADGSTGSKFSGPATIWDKITVFQSHKLIGAIGDAADRKWFTKHIKEQARPFKGTRLTTADTATFIRDELAATVHTFKRVNMLLAGYDEEETGPSLYHIDCTASLNKVEKGAFGGDGSSYSLPAMDRGFHSGMSLEEAIELRVNMLLAGYDEETGPSLYHIDCTASLNKVEKGAFGGDGNSYSLSAMDRRFHSGMSREEAIELVDACIEEIRSSLDVGSPNYIIKIVDEQGARRYAWRKPPPA